MNKFQKQVDEWARQFTVPYWQPLEVLARLAEEVGELARELNHRFGPKKKKATEDVKEIEDEVGDIQFTLSCLCNSLGIDLDESFQKAIDKARGRDNNRYEKKND
ncbi:MAG: nucleotide pyrophosphohydrolase [Candidatus Sungbacteria bacterium]|nr:nucleotide pyrophosphohydrolase [Candidatus Sungbacteria bacterium]